MKEYETEKLILMKFIDGAVEGHISREAIEQRIEMFAIVIKNLFEAEKLDEDFVENVSFIAIQVNRYNDKTDVEFIKRLIELYLDDTEKYEIYEFIKEELEK